MTRYPSRHLSLINASFTAYIGHLEPRLVSAFYDFGYVVHAEYVNLELTTSTRQAKKGVRFYAHPYKATATLAET
jgi:hypothetical protein